MLQIIETIHFYVFWTWTHGAQQRKYYLKNKALENLLLLHKTDASSKVSWYILSYYYKAV